MPIETICQKCARKLRVADEYAGKKARCPQCGTIYVVPGPFASAARGVAETIYKTPTVPGVEKWQVRTPDGRTYGPVPKSELDLWVREGRIPPEAVLLSDSASGWRPAGEIYPQLLRSGPLSAAANPFAERAAASPFRSPSAASAGVYRQPHRGTLILIFGILGWVVCFIFAPMAWAMGHADLREMRRGQMDDSGRSLTQSGMILGMVETILGLIILAVVCIVGVLS